MTTKPLVDLLLFWAPLAANWIFMACEGPLLAAYIARMPDQKLNLAAHGIAFSIGLLIEAPIMMMLSASNALVRGRESYRSLRAFNLGLCALLTLTMLVLQLPVVFDGVARLLNLSEDMAERTRGAMLFLLAWPGAIGIRRLYQGILIHSGRTAAVGWGTLLRLATVSSVGALLYFTGLVPGFALGTCALACGVLVEMAFACWQARKPVAALLERRDPVPAMAVRQVARYYLPLALTSVFALAINPMVTLFVGNLPFPLESLAVLPLVNNFIFLFSCPGISLQEVLISWFSRRPEARPLLKKVAFHTGLVSFLGVSLVAATPLRDVWFGGFTGLQPNLLEFIALPLLILSVQTSTNTLSAWQRAEFILARRTRDITLAGALEVVGIAALLGLALVAFPFSGAVAAALALVGGRLLSVAYLVRATLRTR